MLNTLDLLKKYPSGSSTTMINSNLLEVKPKPIQSLKHFGNDKNEVFECLLQIHGTRGVLLDNDCNVEMCLHSKITNQTVSNLLQNVLLY